MKTRIKPFFPSLTFSSPFSRLPLSYLLLTFLTLFAASVASAQIPSTGLVGYWPFNGNANDESGNGNNGIIYANLTSDRFGNPNSAYNFNQGSKIEVPMTQQLFELPIRSFSCWFRLSANQTGGRIYETTFQNGGIGFYAGSIFDTWYGYSQHCCNIVGLSGGPIGVWHHLVVNSNDNTGFTQVYLDGVEISTSNGYPAGNGCFSNTAWQWQGAFMRFGQGASGEAYFGDIDDIAIYNRALTPAEITQLYTDQTSTVATPPCPTLATNLQTGLVGYWPFCGNANDESGNGNNGTVNGPTLTTDRYGNLNSAFIFDGVNDFITIPSSSELEITGDITISLWKQSFGNTGNYETYLTKSSYYSNWNYSLASSHYFGPGGCSGEIDKYMTGRRNFDGAQYELKFSDSLVSISNGHWKNIVLVVQNNVVTFYIDGIPTGTDCFGDTFNIPAVDVGAPITIGSCNCALSHFMNGKLDDITIYNRALTPSEITQLFTNPSTTPPVACTPFLGEDQTVCAGTSVILEAGQSSYSIGQTGPAGGIVFHTQQNPNGETQVFEAAPSDIGNVMWGCAGFVMNQTSAAIGSGQQNTNAIISACGNSTAAALCANYTLNGADDWYLPSINELTLMFQNLWANGMGNFNAPNGQYWSSTENSSAGSMIVSIDGALPPNYAVTEDNKSFTDYIRPCRSFTVANNTYLWSTGATTATINVTPSTTTTYTCTVADANGNVCADSVTVFVSQIEATDLTICAGETTTLSVSGINSTATPSACPTLPTNLQTGLVGYWPFCGNANDASGNGNNGTVNGATLTTDRFGNANSAYSFDGLNDFIEVPVQQQSVSNYSIGCWFNYPSNPSSGFYKAMVQASGGYPNSTYSLSLQMSAAPILPYSNFTNKVSVSINGPGVFNGWTSNNLYNDNDWHYLTGVLSVSGGVTNSSDIQMYLDGNLINSSSFPVDYGSVPTPVNGTGNTLFGMMNHLMNGRYYEGQLDDIAIYSRALSATEIQQLYTLGQTTYLWSNGATTPTINVSPTSTTTYTCTVTTNGVSCTDSVTVVVSNPVIDLGADVTVCGTSTTLTAPSGYDSYLWSNGGTTNTTTVTANGTYSCTVTQGGCSATDSIDVTLIDATITASDSIICAGETVNLGVMNCPSLSGGLDNGLVGFWPFCGNANDESGNNFDGVVAAANLTADRFGSQNSAYQLNGANSQISTPFLGILGGNSRTISFWADVDPFVSELTVIQYGSSSSANGGSDRFGCKFANNGTPSVGIDIDGSQVTYAFPNLFNGWHLFTYTFSSSDVNSINNVRIYADGNLLTTLTQNYIPFPAAGVLNTTADLPLTFGGNQYNNVYYNGFLDDVAVYNRALSTSEIQELYTLNSSSFEWSNGATTPTINVSPTSTTIYTCTVTTNGVSCADSVTVVVSQPVASITPNGIVEICQGQSIALTANGGVSYLWNTGAPTQSITVNTEAVYTVTVTDANGCTDTESQLVKVNFLPNIGVNNASICPGQSTTLTATGGLSYVWSPATGLSSTTGTTVTASPSTSTVYTVTGTGANGCTNTATAAVTVNAAPTATITPATATTFCQGGSVVLNANTGTGLTYQWFNNAAAITGATTSSYTANASGSYIVVVTNTSTCSATSAATVVTVNALPIATITAATATTFCQGGSVVLNANTGTGLTYQWRLNGTNITGATTSTYTANASGSYTVVVTNTSTCSATSTATVVTVNALPTATITPATATTFCQGGSVVLNANTGTGLSYQWYNNTGIISGATSASYTANASGSYTVVVTNTSTCSATSTATVVTVNALPTATITPATSTTFCQGGSVVLNANTGTGLSYQWRLNGTNITGATSASYTANASGSYTVVVTNTSTCSATSAATVVTVNALPTATITPATATTFCQGGSVVLNANTGTGLSYQWFNNAVAISGATSSSYTANASGSFTVVVTNTSTCSSTSTATVVTVNALPTATITPATATTFCQGGSVVLNANTGAGLTYQWRLNGTNITGATSSSYTANASGSYTVVVTNTSTCSATSTATVVTVNALPTATITASSATTFCQGGSVLLNANTGTGLTYQWRLNGTNITGATTSSYTANASGSYTVVVTNTSTCSATSTATVVTVNALPTATITAATATTFCQGGSVVLNANTGTGLSYQWFNNAAAISGATSSSYTANASGSFTVVVTNTSTCSSTSTATVVTVNALPTATITAATATTFCQGGSVVLNANTGAGLTYQWRLNGTNITGATSSSYTANASGSYTVVVTNTSTCSATSTATVVTVNVLPTATITPATATTFCQGGSVVLNANTGSGLTYQWYNNATIISGATSSSYTANASGSFTVVVTNTSTCSATSTAIDVTAVPNVDYFADTDGDGFGDITTLISTCVQPQGYVTDNTDCKDNDAAIFPGTQEICNDVDDDCNDLIDDGLVFITYYADADGDSFGDINNPLDACLIPDGYVTNNTDCNDNDANQNNSSIEICNGEDDDCDGQIDNGLIFLDYYADLDSDGFGAGAATNSCVDLGAGYVTNNSDCNDNNANQNVASIEICNGEDDDCDGAIDNGLIFLDYYADLDSDGFGSGAATNSCVDLGAGYVTNNTDCNNANVLINPNATEICNSIDDNCDGQIDEGITFTTYYQDFDNDGFGTGDAVTSCTNPGAGWVTNNTDCDDTNGNTNPNATETCNSIDDNCDGQIDEGVQTVYFIDNDGDTYGNPSVSILACTQPIGYTPDDTDCNDNDANINPGAEDIGGNGIDENCDGEIDNSIFELNATISLYPNPTRSELNIQVNSSTIGSDLYIFDAVGKLVHKQQLLSTQTTIPVSNFADGNYVLRVGEVVKRFVVEK